jgi:hypothetical protein
MAHVFISYVHEDTTVAEYVGGVLRANGVEVFWDHDIQPGRRWLEVVRERIETGDYFVPLFSRQWEARSKTVANEELSLAIEQLRRMPHKRAWFIGLRIDGCEVPDNPISAVETIRSLQFIDAPKLGWGPALESLLRAVGIAEPKLPDGDPLGGRSLRPGEVVGGRIVFNDCTTGAETSPALKAIPGLSVFRGMQFYVSGGVVGRAPDGTVAAYLMTDAPNANLQKLNEYLGLHSLVARSTDRYVSDDPAQPTLFRFSRRYAMKAGDLTFDPTTSTFQKVPFDLTSLLSYEVEGCLVAGGFQGKFRGKMDYAPFPLELLVEGECELRFEPDHGPPADFAELEATLGQRVTAA